MSDFNSLFSQFYHKATEVFQEELQTLIESDSTDNLLLDIANLKCSISLKEKLFECVCVNGDNKTISRIEQINRLKSEFGEDYFKSLSNEHDNVNHIFNLINSTIKNIDPSLDINDCFSDLLDKFSQSNSMEEESIEINEETNPI